MNDYFHKWCCLIVIDHPAVNNKPTGSVSISAVQHLIHHIEKTGCVSYIYGNKVLDHKQIIWHSIDQANAESIVSDAFASAFKAGFRKVILFDPDFLISTSVLEEAFLALKMIEFCIGPNNNGCYLLGMNVYEPAFFENLPQIVLSDRKALIRSIGQLHLATYKTPSFSDISIAIT
jgi:hypothetical protein